MKKAALILFFTFSFFSFVKAQKCNYDVNEYDQFLKLQKVEKKVKLERSMSGWLTLDFCKYGSNVFFRIVYIKDGSMVVGKTDAVMFLLSNGNTIKAYPDQIYSSTYNGSGFSSSQEVLKATYNFENESDIDSLKTTPVKSIRVYYNDAYHDFEIKKKYSQNLEQTANCF